MTNLYVRSVDGLDTDDGLTWSTAKATLTGAAAIDVAGDQVNVAPSHSELAAGAVALAFEGTPAAPVRVICAEDTNEPPTVATTGALVRSGSGSGNSITLTGSVQVQGVAFRANQGGNSSSAMLAFNTTAGHLQVYERCVLEFAGIHAASRIAIGANASNIRNATRFVKSDIKFGNAAQALVIHNSKFRWHGGSVLAGTTPNNLIVSGAQGIDAEIAGVDLSNLGTNSNLVEGGFIQQGRIMFRNCRLPASWTGGLIGGAITTPGCRIEMHNCDSTSTNYRLWVEEYGGSVKSETAIVRNGGASDGVTPMSWRMASNVNAPSAPLESPEIARWNDVVNTPITVTVEVLQDSATDLTDGDAWVNVQYLGTTGAPLSMFASGERANILGATTSHTASTATWLTTGVTTPNKQKLSVTFTPRMAGFLQARVVLSKANTVLYVDPKLQVS